MSHKDSSPIHLNNQTNSIFISSEQHSNTTPEDLSERWIISVAQAKLTLKATTQCIKISLVTPLSRRYRGYRMFGVK